MLLATFAPPAMPAPALAQPAMDARIAVALDALDPSAFEDETRGTVEGAIAPELAFASRRGRIHYRFEGGSFNTPGDWSFLSHLLGAAYRVDLGAADKARLFVGGSGAWRRNGDAWAHADYDGLAAFANLELRPSPSKTLRVGYQLADRTFAQLPELDQLEQDGFASLNVGFQSRTTLIAESHFGWKSYAGGALAQAPPASTLGGSHGSGGSGHGPSGGAMGAGMRRAPRFAAPVGNAGQDARQWNGLLRLAQGLGERTGAWVQGFLRRTGGDVPPAVVATPAGFFDDGVYDDPFASDMGALSAGLKHAFPGGAELQAAGSWQTKDYTAVVALDAAGLPLAADPLREDRITRGGAGLSLPLPAPGAFSLAVALEYAFTRSRSNDAFYDYRDHAFALSLTVER